MEILNERRFTRRVANNALRRTSYVIRRGFAFKRDANNNRRRVALQQRGVRGEGAEGGHEIPLFSRWIRVKPSRVRARSTCRLFAPAFSLPPRAPACLLASRVALHQLQRTFAKRATPSILASRVAPNFSEVSGSSAGYTSETTD